MLNLPPKKSIFNPKENFFTLTTQKKQFFKLKNLFAVASKKLIFCLKKKFIYLAKIQLFTLEEKKTKLSGELTLYTCLILKAKAVCSRCILNTALLPFLLAKPNKVRLKRNHLALLISFDITII